MIAGWGPDDRRGIEPLDGGVTAPLGFVAGGVASGVKPSGRPDLAIVAADRDAATAVMTTTNQVKAPSCTLSEAHAADGVARAVVVNAGNANVCTVDAEPHARVLAATAAHHLGIDTTSVLVMSTGVIGEPLPIERIVAAMPRVAEDLDADGGERAADAICTTDTHVKQSAVRVVDADGATCVVGGMAKGVGMIEPRMATMLAVLTTDAPLEAAAARRLLAGAVGATFNRISVDGDRSTSDTVALLANGAMPPVAEEAVGRAIHAVCADLARMIVADGEGASRIAAVRVRGAATDDDAERLARAAATSLLVRAALHGADPNWGRILMALGNAGVPLDVGAVGIECAGTRVCESGFGVPFDRAAVARAMAADEVDIAVEVGAGPGTATVLTCDLTPEYVRFNAEYTT